MTGSPYGIELSTFLNPIGMPCWKPPYGFISAYDLKTGAQLWREPFGADSVLGLLHAGSRGAPSRSAARRSPPADLIFIGASMDSRVRAIDLRTGKMLWKHLVAAPAVALPAIYEYKGKQYVVFTAGGNSILTPRVSDQIIAFSLPN